MRMISLDRQIMKARQNAISQNMWGKDYEDLIDWQQAQVMFVYLTEKARMEQ